MFLIGCDVAKATLDVACFDASRQVWHERSKIANRRAGYRQLLSWMRKLADGQDQPLCLVVEATGVYHLPLAEYMHNAGVAVIITNPGRAADHAKSQNRLNKTDRLDARGLWLYGTQLERYHVYDPHSPAVQALQALLSRLRQLDQDLLRERNRLEKCPFIPGSDGLASSIKRQIRQLDREKQRLQAQIDQTISADADLRRVQRRLMSIKGIGKQTSQWLLPLLYRDQFDSPRRLAAFLGLTPIRRQSGTSLHQRGRLSGRGNRYLRSRLYMPAVCASTHDPAMARLYDTLIGRGKAPKQALTAVMRKLVHVCYGVVKNDQDYTCPVAA